MAFSAVVLNAQWVGIDSRVANSFAHPQPQSEWCWAASSQLVLALNGISTTQPAIVQRVHGNLRDLPGSDDDITSALTTTSGTKVATATVYPGFPSSGLLLRELSARRPLLIEFVTGPQSGHVVVITSVEVTETAVGPFITSLVLRDPFPTPENVKNSGRVQLNNFNISQFAQMVRAYWIVTIRENTANQYQNIDARGEKAPRRELVQAKESSAMSKTPTQVSPKPAVETPPEPGTPYAMVTFRPISEAMPILLEGMKDSFAFERVISGKESYVATGIEYRGQKAYCFLEVSFACGMTLFESTEGPKAKAAFDELKQQLPTLMPGWTCTDRELGEYELAAYVCTQKDFKVTLSVGRIESFSVGLDLKWWKPAPK
jgi:hypothetical protein